MGGSGRCCGRRPATQFAVIDTDGVTRLITNDRAEAVRLLRNNLGWQLKPLN